MRPDVLPTDDHGGDVVAAATALGVAPSSILDLSASLNPFAPDVSAIVRDRLDHLTRYPEPAVLRRATSALAVAMAVDPDRLLLTNGAAEAIALVAAEHPVGDVVAPEFSLYQRHLDRVVAGAPRWRSNPNNPLGTLAGPAETALVWDESFWPLATGSWSRGDPDAYRIGSLTKLWHCPGLRLGYVVAPSPQAQRGLAARQPAWSVSGLALAVVEPLLAGTDLVGWTAAIALARDETAVLLRGSGFGVTESAANWILVADAGGLRDELARNGVLTRDCASFGLVGTVRIAVPDAVGLDRLARALRAT